MKNTLMHHFLQMYSHVKVKYLMKQAATQRSTRVQQRKTDICRRSDSTPTPSHGRKKNHNKYFMINIKVPILGICSAPVEQAHGGGRAKRKNREKNTKNCTVA